MGLKKTILAMCLCIAASVALAQEADIRVQAVYTNEAGRIIVKTISLEGWKAVYDGSNWTARISLATIGTNGVASDTSAYAGIVADGVDIDTTDPYKGLRGRDTNGTAWVLAWTTNGTPFGVQDSGSPQYPFTNRVAEINKQSDKREKANKERPQSGKLQERIKRIEKILNIDY